jgi:hypothetical protein
LLHGLVIRDDHSAQRSHLLRRAVLRAETPGDDICRVGLVEHRENRRIVESARGVHDTARHGEQRDQTYQDR